MRRAARRINGGELYLRRFMRWRRKITGHIAIAAIVSLVWMSIVIPSIAQTLDRGEINGTIRDESGACSPASP